MSSRRHITSLESVTGSLPPPICPCRAKRPIKLPICFPPFLHQCLNTGAPISPASLPPTSRCLNVLHLHWMPHLRRFPEANGEHTHIQTNPEYVDAHFVCHLCSLIASLPVGKRPPRHTPTLSSQELEVQRGLGDVVIEHRSSITHALVTSIPLSLPPPSLLP